MASVNVYKMLYFPVFIAERRGAYTFFFAKKAADVLDTAKPKFIGNLRNWQVGFDEHVCNLYNPLSPYHLIDRPA